MKKWFVQLPAGGGFTLESDTHDSVLLADDRLESAELYRAAAMFFATL